MGVTFNYLANNLEILMILGLIVARLVLLYLALGLCKRVPLFRRRKKISYLKYFMVDFISMTPTMTIAAVANFLRAGDCTSNERVSSLLHLLTFFAILLMPFGFIVISISQAASKSRIRKKASAKSQKFVQEAVHQFLRFLLVLFIPLLCALQHNVGFFCVVSLVILLMLAHYCRYFKRFSVYSRIAKALELLILITHHLAFLLMLIFTKFIITQEIISVLRISGFVVIFTVVCGGAVELLDAAFVITFNLVRFLVKIFQSRCKKDATLDR